MAEVDFSLHYGKKWYEDLLFRWVDKKKIKILKADLDNSDLKVLDYGCGTGEITSKINGCKVYGIDNNAKLLKIAKSKGLAVTKADFESLPFSDNFFDAVISIDTIEHVKSRHKAFAEIKRVLKPNGSVYIFTPCYSSFQWVLAEKCVNTITGRNSGHISPFTRESLDFFTRLNFKRIDCIMNINCGLGLFCKAKSKQ